MTAILKKIKKRSVVKDKQVTFRHKNTADTGGEEVGGGAQSESIELFIGHLFFLALDK